MRLMRVVLVLTALLTLAGCGQQTPVPSDTVAPEAGGKLDGIHWVLVAMGDEGVLPEAMQAWIEFSADGQVNGNGGCNGFFGDYETKDDGSLTFGMIGMTEMWCQETGDLEVSFHEYLQTVTAYAVDANRLSLFDVNNDAVLVFEPGETLSEPDPVEDDSSSIEPGGELTDIRWVLTGMSDMELQYADVEIHITFGADNQANGNSGCNEFFGGYLYTPEGSLSFGPMAMTKMACADTDAYETEFHTLIADVTSYAVDGNKLYLYNADGLDVLRFEMDPNTPVSNTPESGFELGGDLAEHRWILADMGNDDAEQLFPWVRIFIQFDENNNASGNGGCNGYSGEYTLDGEGNISFGPFMQTMMFCDDTGDMELAYHERLATATSYAVTDDVLRLLNENGDVVLRFRTDPVDASDSFTRNMLDSGTYRNEFLDDGEVTLSKGLFRAPVVEGSAEEIRVTLLNYAAFADFEGDGLEDAAVIFATSTGGTGTFYTLVVVKHRGDGVYGLEPVDLGDRIQVQDLRIEDGDIAIDMLRHGPDDPMCCPSEQATVTYRLQDGQLIEVADM